MVWGEIVTVSRQNISKQAAPSVGVGKGKFWSNRLIFIFTHL